MEEKDTDSWRSQCKNVIEQHLYMLHHGINTDCILLVENQRVRAHSFMLIRSSHIFQESLKSSKEIKLNGILNTDILNLMLRHIYGEDLSNSTLTIRQIHLLWLVAVEYKINTLLNFTTKYTIDRFLNPNTVWTLLETAESFKNDDLKQKCYQLLDINLEECLIHFSHSVEKISEETIIYILTRDKLFGLSLDELYIINLIDQWAQIEAHRRTTNIRTILKNILPLIRFQLLTVEELLTGPAKQWLLPEESIEILHAIVTKKENLNYPKHLSQSTSSRFATEKIFVSLWNPKYEKFDDCTSETQKTNKEVSTIIFSVAGAENMYLKKICIRGYNYEYHPINCELKEFNNDDEQTCVNYFGKFAYTHDKILASIKFKTIVPLKVHKIYVIEFTVPDEITGLNHSKIHLSINSPIKIIDKFRNYSTNNVGFIAGVRVYG